MSSDIKTQEIGFTRGTGVKKETVRGGGSIFSNRVLSSRGLFG